ncbi:N-acetyltransferase [Geothrix limicola]|uniref:N-acetyltransferase n=1 Tax=Geothrix limicola TaxID=2927978 RepID=A0ABQ5QCL1_9BACT|nr:GNAT family N-acetyltransferase [Geothrix limicola]GLH72148.1 N-acetyltransferase [Geothrix limicola]
MASVLLRPAGPADAATLADLGARTFRETFEQICSPEDMEAFLASTYGEAVQRAELLDPSRPALVLEVDGVPIGFAQLRLGHREPCITSQRPVELQRIYVLRAGHGGGHGAALMRRSLELAREWGADLIWLGVWEHNNRALAFYARSGFREVGEHIFQIGDQADRDLILAKDLS